MGPERHRDASAAICALLDASFFVVKYEVVVVVEMKLQVPQPANVDSKHVYVKKFRTERKRAWPHS